MVAAWISSIHTSLPIPPSASSASLPPFAIPQTSSPVALFFCIVAMSMGFTAAATTATSPDDFQGFRLVRCTRTRLRPKPLRRSTELPPPGSGVHRRAPDLPPDVGPDPPGSIDSTSPPVWSMQIAAGLDPGSAIRSTIRSDPGEMQPSFQRSQSRMGSSRAAEQESLFSGELLRSHIRAEQRTKPKIRAGYPNQAALQFLAFGPSRTNFWAQAVKPNWSPLGWFELSCRSRYVGAQFIGPLTFA